MKSNQTLRIIFRTLLVVSLGACSGLNQSQNPQRLRVIVGQIKEISLASRPDSAFELIGSSENKEIVEVSNQQLTPADATPATTKQSGQTVFLIKGITTGTAKVVLTEKERAQTGPGRIRRTYLVEVVDK